MDQPVNRNSLCRKCRRYRIDEERHVIVDDRQPHQPSIADTFQRLQGNDRFSDCTNANCTRQKSGRVLASLLRSEEHTSELQSLMRISYAVFCLKKKNKRINIKKYLERSL